MGDIISLNIGYNKRFPSDFSLEYNTFLNDKGINAELYAILLGLSKVIENSSEKITYVKRGDINKTKIAETLGVSRPTLNKKFEYLKDRGYLIEDNEGYQILTREICYLDIPVETLWYLQDTLKEEVIKTYIYLGVRYNYKKDYQFTLEEIGAHCGISLAGHYERNYTKLNNILAILKDCGLIDFEKVYVGKEERKQLKFWKSRPTSLQAQYQLKKEV
jgi:DNA-binding XRE family transcriptional regulator